MAALAAGTAIALPGVWALPITAQQVRADLTQAPRATAGLPVVEPAITCAALGQRDFGMIPGAPTTIVSATVVPAGGTNAYDYCRVAGIVAPQIEFELRLPTATYRQRYLQEGCGGYCGRVSLTNPPPAAAGCTPVTDGSFVIGQDNQGHQGGGPADVWAVDPQLKVDFGYRSEHVFALAAKAIISTFYGKVPKYSYYVGCSNGGREALMEAQRYPDDFDGIIAGAPADNQTALNAMEEAYQAIIDYDEAGNVILPAFKVGILHQAVMEECADPALRDGTIQDPRDCDFNPASIQCADDEDEAHCLTAAQLDVVRRIYAGVVAPDGTHLYTGGEPYGSELGWPGLLIPTSEEEDRTSTFFYRIGAGFLRWVGTWDPEPDLELDGSLFTRESFEAYRNAVGGIYDATDPDLSVFADAGGRLIQWHGWADQYIPPTGSTTYYQALVDTLGPDSVHEFYRLYMFPGVYHCGGGYGRASFDLLTPLIAWVERGTAPGPIIAAKIDLDADDPVAPAHTQYTRPVYPYPQRVAYTGSGDPNDAANYAPYLPEHAVDDHYEWAGEPFRSGYQQWCDASGTQLTCSQRPGP